MPANNASSDEAAPVTRPANVTDLVLRLQDPGTTSVKECDALQALAAKMVEIFMKEKYHDRVHEVTALAPILDRDSYQTLLWAFVDALATGTADGRLLQPQLCNAFVRVLRSADRPDENIDVTRVDMRLGLVLESLKKRLDAAGHQAESGTQYQLVNTLASVLDAMNDTKKHGIDRESLHGPLLEELEKLSKVDEVRLAQAASYAFQALRSIPDNEGPTKALLRNTIKIVGATSKVAGAVSTADPSKLFDGLVALADLPDLISSMIDVVKSVSELVADVKRGIKTLENRRSPKGWYIALRYSDMLIQAKAFMGLEAFIKGVPCRKEVDFLCGLYAQLEHAWDFFTSSYSASTEASRKELQHIAGIVPAPDGGSNDLKRVEAWREAIAGLFSLPTIETDYAPTQTKKRLRFAVLEKNKDYSYGVAYQTPIGQPPSTGLLSEAWPKCGPALVFYADEELRRHHLAAGEKMLEIKRISGATLSMAQCYINLAVVDKTRDADKAQRSTPATQLSDDAQEDENKVEMSNLFSPRKCADGGVRKIVHELTRSPPEHTSFPLWAERYDRVLWLPLRNLKLHNVHPGYTLCDLARDEFFPRLADSSSLAKALDDLCTGENEISTGRTLFLLDGLDEVSQLLDAEHKAAGFLLWLLDRPDVIITSRPGSNIPLSRLDCELETVGFTINQIRAYLEKTMRIDLARDVRKFLYSRPLLLNLVRIPVQLDALCYFWNESMSSNAPAGNANAVQDEGNLATMTDVYEAITGKLWRKDIPRVKGAHNHNNFTDENVQQLAADEVMELMEGEINFVQSLAFAGFYHEVAIFDQSDCEYVRKHLRGPTIKGVLNNVLANLTCLRASDASSLPDDKYTPEEYTHRTYHFIHLTYQEFFAAQFYVRQWKSNKDGKGFLCPKLGKRKQVRIHTHAYLQKNKYSVRHNIFWRFVAGLLRETISDGDEDDDEDDNKNDDENHDDDDDSDDNDDKEANRIPEHLGRFFRALEQEPRDLLGPVHQRVVMYCLSEADPTQATSYFDAHRDLLRRWMLCECGARSGSNISFLASQAEFPSQIYETALQNESECMRNSIIDSVSRCTTITSMDFLSRLVNDISHADFDCVTRASRTLGYQTVLSRGLIQDLLSLIRPRSDKSTSVYKYLIFIFERHAMDVMLDIIEFVEDERPEIRGFAATIILSAALQNPALPQETIDALVSLLRNLTTDPPENAIGVLHYLNPGPRDAIDAIVMRLRHPDQKVVLGTIKSIGSSTQGSYWAVPSGTSVPEEVLLEVVSLLQSLNADIAGSAQEILWRLRHELPGVVLEAIDDLLKSTHDDMQTIIIRALEGTKTTLTPGIIDRLRTRLHDTNCEKQIDAINVLTHQTLPDDIIKTLLRMFHEEQSSLLRTASAETLGCKEAPRPPYVLHTLAAALDDPDGGVSFALFPLICRENLPDNLITVLVEHFNEHMFAFHTSLEKYVFNSRLPQPAMAAFIRKFYTLSPSILTHTHYVRMLLSQAEWLPDAFIYDLVEEHRRLRREALNDPRESDYDDYVFTSGSGDFIAMISQILAKALANRPDILPNIEDYFLEVLLGPDHILAEQAVDVLSHPDLVSVDVLTGLTEIVLRAYNEIGYGYLHSTAVRALYNKSTLPVHHQYAVVKRILTGEYPQFGLEYSPICCLILSPGVDLCELTKDDKNLLTLIFEALWKMGIGADPDITWCAEGETHFVLNLSGKSCRFAKADFPAYAREVQQFIGIPEALPQE